MPGLQWPQQSGCPLVGSTCRRVRPGLTPAPPFRLHDCQQLFLLNLFSSLERGDPDVHRGWWEDQWEKATRLVPACGEGTDRLGHRPRDGHSCVPSWDTGAPGAGVAVSRGPPCPSCRAPGRPDVCPGLTFCLILPSVGRDTRAEGVGLTDPPALLASWGSVLWSAGLLAISRIELFCCTFPSTHYLCPLSCPPRNGGPLTWKVGRGGRSV